MKIFLSLIAGALLFVSCNDKPATETTKTEAVAEDTTKMEYAYTVENDWDWGSKSNLQTVLSSLKAFENGDIDEAAKGFADSVYMQFDNFEKMVSNDSLKAIFKHERSQMKSVSVKMDDYESVKSKDGKREFVSLWYKQINEDLKGKKDSVECMDDMEMKNGKIVLLNEKTRHYAVKKAK